MIMRKIKKGTFLDLILSDISEDEVRRTASKMAIAAKIAKTLEKRNMSQKDRKSTRLNSSHITNSYADFSLKKK